MPLIDPVEDPKVDETGAIIEENAEPQEEEQKSSIPDKFKGKSAEEIAEMYLNLEKDHGRLANEVGETRKLVDRVLDMQQQQPSQSTSEAEEDLRIDAGDLLSDPTGTLEKLLERREAKIKEAYEARIRQIEGHLGVQQLQSKHGDFQAITNDPEFLQFVQSNPYRARIAQEAVQNNDLEAVDYLITEWKDRHAAPAQEEVEESPAKASPLEQARRASLEGSSSGESRNSGKVFSRAEIIKKKLFDPEGYGDPAYQAEIMKAYAEGRVK